MKIESINISERKGTVKTPVTKANLEPGGVVGDSHFGSSLKQVSFLAKESIEAFARTISRDLPPGIFAENITYSQGPQTGIRVLDRMRIGEAVLEVTQIGKKCHNDGCEIFKAAGKCIMPTEGFFCKVLNQGVIKSGDDIEYSPGIIKTKVISLSDRASQGIYEDKSGPMAEKLLKDFLISTNREVAGSITLIPDNRELLEKELKAAIADKTDIIITVGSTGLSPSDIAPDVVSGLCDRFIPGIMEYIRCKYGEKNPNALLSRSIAGIAGQTIIYTFPGSKKAVAEYAAEIFKTLEHLILVVRGVAVH